MAFPKFKLQLSILIVVCMTAWGVLAIYYGEIQSDQVRLALATGYGLIGLITLKTFKMPRFRSQVLVGFLIISILLVSWWLTIEPSNERDWQPDVAVLPTAVIKENLVTIQDVRNFDYRSEADFTPSYYDRTYDLSKLDSVDLITVYWMGDAIAHVFLSFGFAGTDHVAISIETRKERGEGYSAIKGFFKQYELYYVVADERDVIRLRTNYRKDPEEDVFLYRLRVKQDKARLLFLDYMRKINQLSKQPEFYNTLTTNCTTSIVMHTRTYPSEVEYNWKLLLSGYTAEYAYELGALDTSRPFEELKRLSHINQRAQGADQADDFSRSIRSGLPLVFR